MLPSCPCSIPLIFSGIAALGQIGLKDHLDRIKFILLDRTIDAMDEASDELKANLVKPNVWRTVLKQSCKEVPDEGPGILVFGSAMKLLLFSPTHGDALLEEMERRIREDKRCSYLLSVSSSAKEEQVSRMEDAADNLFITRSTRDHEFRLFLRILRLGGLPFVPDEVQVPIPPEALGEVRAVADGAAPE